MDPATIIALILKGVQIATAIAPIAKEAIPRIIADIEATFHSYTGTPMTDEQRTQLNTDIENLSARLHAPLDPE